MRFAVNSVRALLVATLILTCQSIAVARAAMASTGQIVICSAQGITSITVDVDGNPTNPPHICPDCVLSLGVDDVAFLAAPIAPLTWQRQVVPASPGLQDNRTCVSTQARGPPGSV